LPDEKREGARRPHRQSAGTGQKPCRPPSVVEADLTAIIERVAAGDRAALRRLYDGFGGRLYGVACRILRDPALAEDALQEAFVKIWRNAGKFDRARGSAMGWVVTIVRRAALDVRPREPPAAQVEVPGLARALEALPETHRRALILMYVYGLTHSELAAAMSAPLGTVKSWVRRGATALKEAVEKSESQASELGEGISEAGKAPATGSAPASAARLAK
jgi:RNA polymerase sigma-70 factor, ECF subfamily